MSVLNSVPLLLAYSRSHPVGPSTIRICKTLLIFKEKTMRTLFSTRATFKLLGLSLSIFILQTNLQFKPSAWSDNPEAVTTDFRADRKLAELALGYTKPFDDQIRFEIGAGAGFGENIFEEERSIIDGPTRYLRYSSQLTKYYFQPALIFRPRPGIGMTFSMRASVLDYYNVQSVNYSFEELSSLNLLDLNVRPHAFAEPAFGINFSKGRLRLQNQIMWIYRVSDTPINHQRLKFSFSLIMKLNGKYLKNTESD